MTNASIVLSINPRFAARIFDGWKTVELRRIKPRVGKGDHIFIYESSPTMAVVGYCSVGGIISAPLAELWREVRHAAGVSYAEFNAYYDGTSEGYGILLSDVHRFARPLPLVQLRKVHPGFHPPQSHRYVSSLSDALQRLISQARLHSNRIPLACG